MIHLVVALPAEARILAEGLGLRRLEDGGAFPKYGGDGLAMVVSGPGALAAAAATGYLHAHGGEVSAAWINVGLAGSRRPVGEVCAGHSVRRGKGGPRWYPMWAVAPPVALTEVVTVDAIERDFEDAEAVYEMEAAGFVATASRWTSAEWIHVLKVVSDGPGDRPETRPRNELVSVMTRVLEPLEQMIAALRPRLEEQVRIDAEPPDYRDCLERWHFTVSDRKILLRLLRRRSLLVPERALPLDDLGDRPRGREVNRRLARWLDSVPVVL